MSVKLCRFVFPSIFRDNGTINFSYSVLHEFFKKYCLASKKDIDKVAKRVAEDIRGFGFITQAYLDVASDYISAVNGLAPRILGVYLDPKKISTGILDERRNVIIPTKNSIDDIFDGDKPILFDQYLLRGVVTYLSPVDVVNHYVLWRNYGYNELPHPVFIAKNPSCIVGHGHPIMLPEECIGQQVEPESEVAVYFKKPLAYQTVVDVTKQIGEGKLSIGLTIENDITWQDPAKSIPAEASRIKSQYSFASVGPFLQLNFDINKVAGRESILYLNDEKKQECKIGEWKYSIAEVLSYYSQNFLTAGPTLISMGTNPENLQRLNTGDQVICEITDLGMLVNPIIGLKNGIYIN